MRYGVYRVLEQSSERNGAFLYGGKYACYEDGWITEAITIWVRTDFTKNYLEKSLFK